MATSIIIVVSLILIYSFNAVQETISTSPILENQTVALKINSNSATKATRTVNFQDTPDQATPTALIEINPSTLPPTWTQAPTATLLVISTLGPDMMTPFGPGGQYILHEVQPGESLALLATTYETSIEVLESLNVFPQGSSLWVGQIVLVMPTQTDPSGLSAFQVIRLDVRTRVVDFSEEYNISIADLKLLNSLGLDEWLPAGRWMIVPYSTETN